MGRVEIATLRKGEGEKRKGGRERGEKIRTAGYRLSRRSSLSHTTTRFAGPITDLCHLVRTLETLLDEAVFLGCLPPQMSYNQNSVTLLQ